MLASKGPGGSLCQLDDGQLAELEVQLGRGPAAHGWVEDQRWTLSRVAQLIAGLFQVRYTDRGVGYLLHRIGWSPQVPVHRAAERDDEAVATWVKQVWPQVNDRGGRWSLDLLRRRGRPESEAAEGTHLGGRCCVKPSRDLEAANFPPRA